jgi:hypothetical protein
VVCLQEVKPTRALVIKHSVGSRTFVSSAKYGLLYLTLVLPESARFLERHMASLNGYGGVLPKSWSLRRSYELHEASRFVWRDGLKPCVAQVTRVLWKGREFRAVNTHLPFDPRLRNRCLDLLPGFLGSESDLVTGDFNTIIQNLFLRDFLLATALRPAGTGEPTHDTGRRIVFVLYRGGLSRGRVRGDEELERPRMIRVELEV